jgi:cytochrome c biogenesis protein CcdA
MFGNFITNYKKKSLFKRFLLFIGMLSFFIYIILGIMILFWKKIPLNLTSNQRYLFGGVIIVYAFFRFIRFFNTSTDEEETN